MMRTREQAFTVVEVIIAVLLITVVISGVTLALAGSSKLETKRDIQSRMVAATERVYESLRSDKGWVKGCRRGAATAPAKTCHPKVDPDILEDDIFGDSFKFDVKTTAVGIDSNGDGLAGKDADGNADDFFELRIEISVPAKDAPRLGNPPIRRVTSVVHGSTNIDSGGLTVAFCSADNQIDERVQISGCETGGTYWSEMPACADNPACTPWALDALKGIPTGIYNPSRMLGIRPVTGVSFAIERIPDGEPFDGPATVSSALAVTSKLDPSLGPGVYRFPDLPVGSWRIKTPTVYPGGRIDWPTHHVPSTKQATVERNRTARALVMLQNPAKSGNLNLTFSRLIYERKFVGDKTTVYADKKPDCEGPNEYFVSAFVVASKECLGGGHFVATTQLGAKGQQMDENDFFTKYQSWGQYQDSVTVFHFNQYRSQDEWNGAADTAVFETQPAPRGRYTIRTDGPGGPSYSTPKWSTGTIPQAPHRPNAGWNSTGSKASVTGLPAGLHTPLELAGSSKIKNVSTTYSPGDCSAYLWVRADNNAIVPCNAIHMVGDDGECYTHLLGGVGIPNYKWDDQCAALKWMGKLIKYPKWNLIYQMCGHRQSWVLKSFQETWIEANFSGWLNPEGLEYGTAEYDAAMEAYKQERINFMAAEGYTYYAGTTKYVNSSSGYFYKMENYPPSTKWHHDPCDDMRSDPLDCPQIDRWDNCNKVKTFTIQKSPGWDVGGGNQDGPRKSTKGTGINSMSP